MKAGYYWAKNDNFDWSVVEICYDLNKEIIVGETFSRENETLEHHKEIGTKFIGPIEPPKD